MKVQYRHVDSDDPNVEIKQIRLLNKYKAAYIDRYRRLGYETSDENIGEYDGKKYAIITLKRDKTLPSYGTLSEIEQEIDELIAESEKDEAELAKEKKRKHILRAMLAIGIICIIVGAVLTVVGILLFKNVMAYGGWATVIFGSVVLIVWSFMRDKWRLSRKTKREDVDYPGFGVDELSRQVEEMLLNADKARAGMLEE